MLMLGSSLPQPVMEEEVPGRPPMLFSIIFATLVPEQKPAVFGIDFRVTQYNFSSPLEPSWTVFLQEPVGTSYSALFIAQGDCSDVATNLVRQSTDLADKDPVERIREIYRDVTGQPQCHRVGGPVNIAKIDNDGVHWISGRD
jgi:hypothetical protein